MVTHHSDHPRWYYLSRALEKKGVTQILPFAQLKTLTAGPDDPPGPVLPCTPYKHKKTVSLSAYRGERK